MKKTVLAWLAATAILVSSCSGDGAGSSGNGRDGKPDPTPRPTWTTATEGVLSDAAIDELERGWEPIWPHQVMPFRMNPAGDSVIGWVNDDGFNGIAVLDPKTGKAVERIDEFADPRNYQATGTVGDEFVIWKEFRSLGLDEFVVKAWDRNDGQISEIGEGRYDPESGDPILSPWQDPLLVGGKYAAWVERTSADGTGELVLADLESGERTILPSEHPGWLSSFDSTLIWAESPSAGAPTELHAVDVATKEIVELPEALQALRGAGYLVTDGKAAAWVRDDDSGITLMVLPSMMSEPVDIKTFKLDGFSPPLTLTSKVAVASISGGGIVVVNLSNGRYAIKKDASYANIAGLTFIISQLTYEKGVSHQNALALVSEDMLADIQLAP